MAKAFPRIADVEQPLWPALQERREVQRALAGEAQIASCRVSYYDPVTLPLHEEARRSIRCYRR